MGWLKYALLGDLGNRLDLDEADRKLKEMRRSSRRRRAAQHERDEQQDDQIDALEKENDEIKLLLMELMNTLVQKSVLSKEDMDQILQRVEAVFPDEPIEDDDDPLIDFQRALEES